MSDVEELFGEAVGEARPRTRRVYAVAAAGLVLAALGLACSAVPGLGLVLVGWYLADQEHARWESGFLGRTFEPEVRRALGAAQAAVVLATGIMLVQVILYCSGVYGLIVDFVLAALLAE